jgi:hypothetical protein
MIGCHSSICAQVNLEQSDLIAMRTGSGDTGLLWLLIDHLGSTGALNPTTPAHRRAPPPGL